MTGVFKANNPYNYLLLFIYGLLLKLNFFIHPSLPAFTAYDGYLYRQFIGAAVDAGLPPIFFSSLAFVLLFLQAIAINEVAAKQRLFLRNNYLPAMSYLLITSLFPDWQILSSSLAANSLLVWVLSRLFTMHMAVSPKTIIYNVGLLMASASLIYYPTAVFLLLVLFGIALSRPFLIREWVVLLLGLATPYYFTFAWFYLTDEWKDISWKQTRLLLPSWKFTASGYVSVSFMALLLVMGLYYLKKNLSAYLVQTRKSWVLILFFLLISCSLAFLSGPVAPQRMIGVSIGLSYIAACVFYFPRRGWLSLLLHWAMVGLVIFQIWFI